MATSRKNFSDIPAVRDALMVALAEEMVRLLPLSTTRLKDLLARFKSWQVDKAEADARRKADR